MWRDGRGRSQVCAVQLFPRAQHFAYLNALNLPSNPLHTQVPAESQLYSNQTRSIKHSKESWQRVVPPRPSRSRNRYTLCLFCTYLPILPHSRMTAEDSHATSTVLYRRLFIQYFLISSFSPLLSTFKYHHLITYHSYVYTYPLATHYVSSKHRW